ncbi:hypothetical protein GHK92_10895 [Nocardioides sp. dk4132]|uniref:hypothetical protein n=1 Tax=unclassified Nocardioides TaxID=2615069 RepID=UPI00129815F6|nr:MULTISPECIES: hypothetical protein [unclassified Nocardioides]MQW76384.1 hypothetical protein [Nocardioides sp. dk4132]QGA07340.1 hypothetical protein GFH29_08030 [Nocardioides sp. dk884]
MSPEPSSPCSEAGVRDPVPAPLRRRLRHAVLDHASTERRRIYPALLHLGHPGGRQGVVPVADIGDHSLRTDVVAAMLARHHRGPAAEPHPLVWLTRPGELDLQDLDMAWLAAAWAAHAECGAPLTMVVVNRHGWRDPRSGAAQHWVRLRRR